MTKVICDNDKIVAIYSYPYVRPVKETLKKGGSILLELTVWVLGLVAIYWLMVFCLVL